MIACGPVKGTVEAPARANVQLRRKNAEFEHDKTELIKKVEILDEQIASLRSRFFGRSSESFNEEE